MTASRAADVPRFRRLRFEVMESRRLLAADFGVVPIDPLQLLEGLRVRPDSGITAEQLLEAVEALDALRAERDTVPPERPDLGVPLTADPVAESPLNSLDGSVQYFAEIVDSEGRPTSEFEIGTIYSLRVSVRDVRSPMQTFGGGGLFQVSLDLSYDNHVVPLGEPRIIEPFKSHLKGQPQSDADQAITAYWSTLESPGPIVQPVFELPFQVNSDDAEVQFEIESGSVTDEFALVFGEDAPFPRNSVIPASISLRPASNAVAAEHPVTEPTFVSVTSNEVPLASQLVTSNSLLPSAAPPLDSGAGILDFETLLPSALQAASDAILGPPDFPVDQIDDSGWLDSLVRPLDERDEDPIEDDGFLDLELGLLESESPATKTDEEDRTDEDSDHDSGPADPEGEVLLE